MINKLLIILLLLIFGAAMYLAGLYSPDSLRTKADSLFSEIVSETEKI